MTAVFPFSQVDVFSDHTSFGNPLAVVADAERLEQTQMAQLSHWTNLSETCFLLHPTDEAADYRVRIFTPLQELPFAGHPTLGACHVWLAQGGQPQGDDVVQQCGAGLIHIRRDTGRLFFCAPPLRHSGPLETDLSARVAAALDLSPSDVEAAAWVDNGPGWAALLLKDRQTLLQAKPDYAALKGMRIGLVAPVGETGHGFDFEVRAFSAGGFEDPVTGSLNAGIAQWLLADGIADGNYIAAQGTLLGRKGRVHVHQDGGDIWVGGAVQDGITGTLTL
ncbi:PhzF family phenazine biosynthesis protein [Shimia sagamensis]|uniref:Phenazine biosynthesis protein PhzF family n=1 Tax=Shimia sagamensis TaxID=1566352 RepID=A0ABY1P733_9RHOB|nr:PhzF family phenazine biosynthesis protein [Shimia sagamensis]SMP26391.1 phenazine biosynthesis protein PhzF family [Shimia sagamensis]